MRGFGPPVPVTAPSTWPWIDHSVSGLHPATHRPIKTRFPYASPIRLSSLLNVSRWPIIQKVRSHTSRALPLFVCIRFQVLFHSPPGVLFAFPSRYWFTIGRWWVFSLGGWSPHIQTGFHVSRPTFRTLSTAVEISNTGLSPTMVKLPSLFFYLDSYYVQAPPRSLATTCGISVDFFSSGYLDGSVLRVRFSKSMYST